MIFDLIAGTSEPVAAGGGIQLIATSFVRYSTNTSSINYPAGILPGDLVVLANISTASSMSWSVPSGFTRGVNSGITSIDHAIYSSGTSVSLAKGSSGTALTYMLVFRGAAWGGAGTISGTLTASPVTLTAGSRAIAVTYSRTTANVTYAPTTDWQILADFLGASIPLAHLVYRDYPTGTISNSVTFVPTPQPSAVTSLQFSISPTP